MKLNILIIFLVIIISIIIYYWYVNNIEGFENNIDKIYAKSYDIVFDNSYDDDINNIVKETNIGKNSIILDAGTGVGRHYKLLCDKCDIIGVDISKDMLKYARIRNPNGKFINDNLINSKLFMSDKFTHIICLLDSLYHNNEEDMKKIIINFNNWIKPEGYLCIHLFDRNRMDPAPRDFTQYYKDDEGIKHGLTYFDKFTHDAYWKDIDDKSVKYIEMIVLGDGRKKTQETKLFIPKDKESITMMINKYGFKLENIIEVKGENNIELLIFKKVRYN